MGLLLKSNRILFSQLKIERQKKKERNRIKRGLQTAEKIMNIPGAKRHTRLCHTEVWGTGSTAGFCICEKT